MICLHTMKFIQPHLLRLDLPVERGKLLCHSVTKTNSSRFSLCLLVCMLFTHDFFFFFKNNNFQLCINKTDGRWICLQEHNQQHHSDGNLRQEPAKQPPLHFVSWSELQSTANMVTPYSLKSKIKYKKPSATDTCTFNSKCNILQKLALPKSASSTTEVVLSLWYWHVWHCYVCQATVQLPLSYLYYICGMQYWHLTGQIPKYINKD